MRLVGKVAFLLGLSLATPVLAAPMPQMDFDSARPWITRLSFGWNNATGILMPVSADYALSNRIAVGFGATFSQSAWDSEIRASYRLGRTEFGWTYGAALGVGTLMDPTSASTSPYLAPGLYATIPLGAQDTPFRLRVGLNGQIALAQAGGGSYRISIPWHIGWKVAPDREFVIGEGLGLRWNF